MDKCSFNKRVACTLFPESSVRIEVTRGFAQVKQRVQLTKLEVVFDYGDPESRFTPGDEVWVRGDAFRAAPEVYEVEGKAFTLIPKDLIVLYRSVRDRLDKRSVLAGTPCCDAPPEHSLLDE